MLEIRASALSSSRPPNEFRPPLQPRQAAKSAASARAGVSFQDTDAAARQLAAVSEQLSPELAPAIPGLLAESPDPDSALILLDRLIASSPEVVPLLNRHNSLAHYAIVVFGHSRYLGETLLQNTDLLSAFLREKNLERSFAREEFRENLARFRSRSFEKDVSLLLARFKRREYVRIMLRDVLKLAPLAETTAEISALADVLIEDTLREADSRLQRRYGLPQHLDTAGRMMATPFAVVSLGKLGGNELNYSSDVDLMYLFGDGEEAPDAAISNHEYFVRLAQEITGILSRVTEEGPVFRIDLRLRPQGHEGELAISLSHALHYYESVAQDWERQALIKVRHSAGDTGLAKRFIRGVQPFVYSASDAREKAPEAAGALSALNFAAIKTALEARERMHLRRRKQLAQAHEDAAGIDIKIDRGGIRDIEFLVQCLQRVYGGAEPWLRSRGTLFALQKLHDKMHISGREFHDLTGAYEFLRHLEHRLQLREGQQTHRLPASRSALEILRRSMEGFAPGEESAPDLAAVRRRMEAVQEIQQRILHQQNLRGAQQAGDAPFLLRGDPELGISEQPNQQALDRLMGDVPALQNALLRSDFSPHARKHLLRFLSSVFASSNRYAAVIRSPEAMERALMLFENSDLLSDILIRNPEEIASLAQAREAEVPAGAGYLFESAFANQYALRDPVFAYLASAPSSYSEKLGLLRKHYRHCVLEQGAADLIESREVYRSLAAYSSIARDAIAAAFGIIGAPDGLAVMALGRLGAGEFDALSDADLLFVCEEGNDLAAMIKAASQLIQVLSAYTSEGMVFPVDARLRPRGAEGELVVTPTQMASYFEQEAQAWEALMYIKLQFVAGSHVVAERAMAAVRKLSARFAADPDFGKQVSAMRRKLEDSEGLDRSFKTSPGGVYDLDFLTGYLLIRHGASEKSGNLRDRIWRCASRGDLDKTDAAVLDHGAELLRTVEHVVRLVVARAQKWLPATEHAKETTESLAGHILARNFPHGLEIALEQTLQEVRAVYARLVRA